MKRRTQWTDANASTALCQLTLDDRRGSQARQTALPPCIYREVIAPFLHFDSPLPDQLYVLGGRNGQQDVLDIVEMFDTWHGKWVPCPSMNSCRAGCSAALLPQGQILVVGGYDENGIVAGVLASCEIFDPARQMWDRSCASLNRSRWGHGCSTLQGKVYAVGGCALRPGAPLSEDFMETLRSCEVYDPVANTWSVCADLHVARAGLRSVALNDYQLAAVGGCDDVFGTADTLASVEIYDLNAKSWNLLSRQLSIPRTTAAVAAVDKHKILVMGGAPSLTSAEVFCVPGSAQDGEAWLEVGTCAHSLRIDEMAEGRMGCQAVALKLPKADQSYPLCTSQCVVVVGGENGDDDMEVDSEHPRQFSSIPVFDVGDATWRQSDAIPPIPNPRTAMALCAAPGRVCGYP